MTVDTRMLEKRISQKEARKFKGNTVYHSDIVRSRGGAQSVIGGRLIGASRSEDVDGGKAIFVSETPAYKVYTFYMAPNSSAGLKKITAGSKTVIVNTGTLFTSVSSKKEEYSRPMNAGRVINLEKGYEYALSSGNNEVECLVVESEDLKQKVLSNPVTNLTGLQQIIASKTPSIDVTNIKKRKTKSKSEREELGRKYRLAKGTSTSQEKNIIAKDIARGVSTDSSQTLVGANPVPMGDIGDDYLPDAG